MCSAAPRRAEGPEARVVEAMRYSALAPGKRLRPFLVSPAPNYSPSRAQRLQAAVAVELVHAYSLVHDDCRRWTIATSGVGATCHKQFDDATGARRRWASDLSFEVLAQPDTHGDPASAAVVTASAGGPARGMVGAR